MTYDFRAIEARWQSFWDDQHTFRADIDPERPKYYVLDMFPYPSGDGLHVGHPEGYTATDIVARYKRMRGFNVLHPMGWDAFGLPAERYAMKNGVHPAVRTAECIRNFKRQLKTLGFSYDWEREVDTTDPRYYRWTQWIFLQIWGAWYDAEEGRARPIAELSIPADIRAQGDAAVRKYIDGKRLAYLHDAPVNWCPELRVVLANEEVAEQVEKGLTVVRRPMRQWMMRITAYAERLIKDLEGLDWAASVLDMQRHWIGRSDGAEVRFKIENFTDTIKTIEVFTTRPDTLFGATYMVLAPEHPLVAKITVAERSSAVTEYVDRAARRSERDRQAEAAEGQKTGVFTGAHAINPANGEPIPVWISDYVLMGYGTGAIMAVPGHDERDHAFARAMSLPIVEVVSGGTSVQDAAHTEAGTAVNSGFLDGLATSEAKEKMIAWLEAQGLGRRRVTYKLRDWLFSRQRYWGEPFPLLHQANGAVVPVPNDQLPVTLPELDDFQPGETGEPPLSKATDWVHLPDGSVRETNTMPQWAGSCWYYLRFMDPSNPEAAFDRALADAWLPVDLYVGGAEHAVLHLLYARFWHKVLFDLGHVSSEEPFRRLFNQGYIQAYAYRDGRGQPVPAAEVVEGADGSWSFEGAPVTREYGKMGKSLKNVVTPDDMYDAYGADTFRVYEMSMGPLDLSRPWETRAVIGAQRFLQRLWRNVIDEVTGELLVAEDAPDLATKRLLHRTIHALRTDYEALRFNTAIARLIEFNNALTKLPQVPREAAEALVVMTAPVAPHIAEELWARLGHAQTLTYVDFPEADPALLVDDTVTCVVQVQGKVRDRLEVPADIGEQDLQTLALATDKITAALAGKIVRKVIVRPPGLVNIVAT